MHYENTLDFARQQDAQDMLRSFRGQFIFPKHNAHDVLYFCGNSLGLQPKTVRQALLNELDHWATHGVEGHFRGELPWMYYHKFLTPQTARLVGALPHEVVVMNTLTVNLHLAMVSFYRPTPQRFKIIMEAGAFPSDQYAVESQVRWHGFDPEQAIVEIAPAPGSDTLRTEDIVQIIENEGSTTALVMFGGVNYYTGQFYDLEKIAAAAHRVGAHVGFDLAHAAGNVPLRLHDWNADFAVWCSYKYLNSGPGGPAGLFVHEKHGNNPALPRFAGWWGHDEDERFKMQKGFKPMRGAEGWQLSNAQIFSFAAHKASLDLFDAAGMDNLREKSLRLTGFLEWVLCEANRDKNLFRIITPTSPDDRGCQLSLLTDGRGKALFNYLSDNGAVADWREPNVIRFAPAPLYNSFEDVWRLGRLIGGFKG
ncbi:MAG: kynureninase [Haliscomenobacteraceae bacterium CHB4]|nr:Kynureninase [Saprospiraceae bacterium]MCE7921633.1 kynureninase [Haliscomenobacteraceae bacterium CHB4]